MKILTIPLLLLAAALFSPPELSTLPQQPQDPAPMATTKRSKITTFLWFDQNAEEAVRLYCSTFDDSKVLEESHWGEGGPVPKGTLMTARFRLGSQEFMALNAGPHDQFNDAVSLFVDCANQQEIDRYWRALLAGGGKPIQCGWLQDRFGLRWQIVPRQLGEWLGSKDAGVARRVTAAMMQMQKLDLAKLEAAHAGK